MKRTAQANVVRKFLCLWLIAALLSGCGPSVFGYQLQRVDRTNSSNTSQGESGTGRGGANIAAPVEQVVDDLTAMLPEAPDSLDPQQATNRSALRLLNALSEGLVRFDGVGRLREGSGLAEQWTVSADGTKYRFILRDTTWSDGQRLTAHDFVAAWRRAVDPRQNSPYARLFYPIKNAERIHGLENETEIDESLSELGVEAINERTLDVTLARPYEPFLHQLALPAFFPIPEHAADGEDGETLSIGPFRLAETGGEADYVLVKNEAYWDAASVKLNELNFRIAPSWRERLQLFENGQLHWIDLPVTTARSFGDKSSIHVEPQGVVWYLVYNTESAPFDDVRLRKALSLAINRFELTKSVLQQGGIPATGLTPSSIKTYNGESYARQVAVLPEQDDREQAKKMLGSEINPASIGTVSIVGAPEVEPLLQAIAGMWKQSLGIDTEVILEDTAERVNRALSGNFQVMIDYWVADYADPVTFLRLMTSDSLFNDSRWGNAQYDMLVEKGLTERDPLKRMQALVQAEKLLLSSEGANNMPITPLYWPASYYAVDRSVRNVAFHPVGADVDFKRAYRVERR